MDLLLDALETRVDKEGATKLELYRDISYILAKIRCGHTRSLSSMGIPLAMCWNESCNISPWMVGQIMPNESRWKVQEFLKGKDTVLETAIAN
jgi:hypothetical protein